MFQLLKKPSITKKNKETFSLIPTYGKLKSLFYKRALTDL